MLIKRNYQQKIKKIIFTYLISNKMYSNSIIGLLIIFRMKRLNRIYIDRNLDRFIPFATLHPIDDFLHLPFGVYN